MDLFVGSYVVKRSIDKRKQKEGFSSSAEPVAYTFSILLSFILSIYAVYLSWTCSTAQNIAVGLKVLYAIFAYIFGFLYLIYYVFVNAGRCGA